MRRFCAGLVDIYLSMILHLYVQAQFPTCATRGAGVAGTSTHPSIPNTTVNVTRPKRPSWTSPLIKASRPRLFIIACCVYPILHVMLKLGGCAQLMNLRFPGGGP
jgi:hypothetical protein